MGKDLRATKTGSIGHRRSKLGYNDVGYQVGERISHSKDLNNIISIFLKDKKKKKRFIVWELTGESNNCVAQS